MAKVYRDGFYYLYRMLVSDGLVGVLSKQYGARIEVVYGEEPKDAYQELVEDLAATVTSFAGKLYSMRSHRKKKLVEDFRGLLEEVEKSG